MKLLEDIDDLLSYLEDTAHGEEGKRITEMRHRIHTELSNSHKHDIMQGLALRMQDCPPDILEIVNKNWDRLMDDSPTVANEGQDKTGD